MTTSTTRPLRFLARATTLLLGCVSVVQSSSPTRPRKLLQSSSRPSPRVESIISSRLDQAAVDYENHPFEVAQRRRRLDQEEEIDLDPGQNPLKYVTGEGYETLRIKYITAPVEGHPDYQSTTFNQLLPDVLNLVSETWSNHLSVYPVNGSIPLSRNDCYGFYSQYITSNLEATGIDDADMAIYVGAETSYFDNGETVNLCDTTALAFAFTCSIDQFDRPIIGAINFCIQNIIRDETSRRLRGGGLPMIQEAPAYATLEGNDETADLTLLAIHEVGHALGFTLHLLKYFRDPETGEPQTPRPFTPRQVTCVDGSVQNIVFPSTRTLATRKFPDGRTYHEVVTPRVTQVARNHFNCQSMTGARLENQPTAAANNCTGSHWDERLFLSELMGPIFSGYSDILSPLTLAIFEDSGWYKVSYENAQLSPYGKGRGCDFVNEPCIVNDQVPDYGRDIFCNTKSAFTETGVAASEIVCDPTHKSFTACDLFDINNMPESVRATIPENRIPRFSDPNLASVFDRADFCPLPVIDARLDCTNNVDSSDKPDDYQGESRGLTSRCINGRIGFTVRPGCFPIECDATRHKVVIAGQVCDFDGQELSVRTPDFQAATLTCPVLATICPELFCPGECAGRGVCSYDVVPPMCKCFDPTDTTPGCSGGSAAPTSPPFTLTTPTTSSPAQEPTVDVLPTTLPQPAPTSSAPVQGRTVLSVAIVALVVIGCSM